MKNKETILIVEDDAMLRNALHEKLTSVGFTMLEANNGYEGLRAALDKHPDLILLDLVMPVMDGMAMLKELRQDDWGKTARVIILTNLPSDNNLVNQYLTQSQHSYYLEKSDLKIEDVVKKVQERLSEKASALLPPTIHNQHGAK